MLRYDNGIGTCCVYVVRSQGVCSYVGIYVAVLCFCVVASGSCVCCLLCIQHIPPIPPRCVGHYAIYVCVESTSSTTSICDDVGECM